MDLADNIVSWGSVIGSGACTALGFVVAAECLPVLLVAGAVVGVVGGANEMLHGAAREDPWRCVQGLFGVATSVGGGVSKVLTSASKAQNLKYLKYAKKATEAAEAATKAGATAEQAAKAADLTKKAANMAKSLSSAKLAEAVSQGIYATQGCVNVVEGVSKGDGWKCATGLVGAGFSAGSAAFSCDNAVNLMEWKDAAQKAEVAEGARGAVRELAQSTRQGGPNPTKMIMEGKETKSLWQAATWGKEALAASSDKIQEAGIIAEDVDEIAAKVTAKAGEAAHAAAHIFLTKHITQMRAQALALPSLY